MFRNSRIHVSVQKWYFVNPERCQKIITKHSKKAGICQGSRGQAKVAGARNLWMSKRYGINYSRKRNNRNWKYKLWLAPNNVVMASGEADDWKTWRMGRGKALDMRFIWQGTGCGYNSVQIRWNSAIVVWHTTIQ